MLLMRIAKQETNCAARTSTNANWKHSPRLGLLIFHERMMNLYLQLAHLSRYDMRKHHLF